VRLRRLSRRLQRRIVYSGVTGTMLTSVRSMLLVFLPLLYLSAFGCAGDREPSEHDVLSRFEAHRQAFERLRLLTAQKPKVLYVYDTSQPIIGKTQSGTVVHIPPTSTRATEIRRLMDSLGVRVVMNSDGTVMYALWVDHTAWKSGPSKGIMYTTKQPRPLLSSVDSPTAADYWRAGKVFSHADQDWYVWYEFGT
jgi:hypothetical protein